MSRAGPNQVPERFSSESSIRIRLEFSGILIFVIMLWKVQISPFYSTTRNIMPFLHHMKDYFVFIRPCPFHCTL